MSTNFSSSYKPPFGLSFPSWCEILEANRQGHDKPTSVRGKPPPAAAVASAVTAATGSSPPKTSPTAAEAAPAPAAAHPGDIGTLGYDLDVASLEDTLVENESLRNEAGLSELDIGVAAQCQLQKGMCTTCISGLPLGMSRELV